MTAPQSVAVGLLNGTLPVSSPMADRDVRSAAIAYYDAGFNIGVQPLASKGDWPWKPQQYTRLTKKDLLCLIDLLDGNCNLFAMTGHTSGNFFAMDCETAAELEYQCRQFRRRSIPLCVSQSNSRGKHAGGGTIWAFCRDGELKNIRLKDGKIVTGKAEHDIEIRGSRQYILIPPSLHPEKTPYTWLYIEGDRPPTVSLSELDWLPVSLVKTRRTANDRSQISKATRDILAHGVSEGARHVTYPGAFCDMIAHGIDTAELEAQARSDGLSAGDIGYMVQWAIDRIEAPKTTRKLPFWQRAAAFGQSHVWTGRTAATDRAVWSALCERARDDNRKGIFRASMRELAEKVHRQAHTVNNSIDRLVRQDLLVRCGRNKSTRAMLYRFADHVLDTPITGYQPVTAEQVIQDRAIGDTAMRVWRFLSQHGQRTERQLRDECGLSRDQVVRAVRKLSAIGAAINVCANRHTTSQVGVDTVPFSAHIRSSRKRNVWKAAPIPDGLTNGVLSKAVQRRERHSAERSNRAFNLVFGVIVDYLKARSA